MVARGGRQWGRRERFNCEAARERHVSHFYEPSEMKERKKTIRWIRRVGWSTAMICLLFTMPADLSRAATNDFLFQTITLPTNVTRTLFASLNKNGFSDLL